MTKILKLESASFRQKRLKFEGDIWLTVSPFVDISSLEFGNTYQLQMSLDKSSQQWYIENLTLVVPEKA